MRCREVYAISLRAVDPHACRAGKAHSEGDTARMRVVRGRRAWHSLFGLDVHTRVGRRAVRELPKHARAVRALLARSAPDRAWYDASANAVFHAESALVGSRLEWELGRELRAGGIRADFMALGISPEAGLQLIAAVKDDLPTLNHLRQELFLAHEFALR